MIRTLAITALVTLFGAATSEAQYRDSYPPDEDYVEEYGAQAYDDDYDYELLGDPDEYGYNEPDIDVGIFASLGNDGRWHFAANFGWVWRPYAKASWRPYSHGHWVWTSHGWTWVSYEPFGWATYHYGYWASDPYLGWVWIPGYEWSAARVQWAYYDNYISWAPLGPPGYYCPRPWTTAGFSVWFTVGARNFCNPYPVRYCERPRYKSVYVERVRYKSPDRHFVERSSGRTIRTSTVEFKHKSWSKSEGRSAKISSSKQVQKSRGFDRVQVDKVKTKSRDVVSRSWNAPKSGRSESKAIKSKSAGPSKQFRAQESRRVVSKSQAVKPQQRTTRESRAVRSEQPSKQRFDGKANRETRSIQKSRGEKSSKASMQASRSSGERKAVSKEKSGRREVAKGSQSKSSKGRGKAR